jgi:HEAT repeat protein
MIATAAAWALLAGAQDVAAIDEALARFRAGYAQREPARRVAAVEALARTPSQKALQALAPLLVSDVKDVRVAAAKALSQFRDHKKTVLAVFTQSLPLNSREPEARAAILQGLAAFKEESTLPLLHASFRDPTLRVAKAAVAAAGSMGYPATLDALYALLKDESRWRYVDDAGASFNESTRPAQHAELRKEIVTAFQAITREKWALAKEWLFWYEKRRATFKKPE